MKKFLISSIIFSILILTACSPAAPIATATSVPSETPTIQPSSTPTATPTLEPTIEATATQPAPPANPEFIEGIGKITSVVQRESDGKYYGLDKNGLAIAFQNEKDEWVHYDRPTGIAQNGITNSLKTVESLGITEIKLENVTRLKGGVLNIEFPWINNPTTQVLKNEYDNDLPFGVVLEEKPYENRADRPEKKDLTHVWISGINLGTTDVTLTGNEKPSKFLIFKVPLLYGDQIYLIMLPDQPNPNDGVFLIPESHNVQNAERAIMTDHDIMNALSANNSVGDQLVLAVQINNTPEMALYEAGYKVLIDNLKTGTVTDTIFTSIKSSTRIVMLKP